MLKESLVTALSEQVNAEMYSAYLYLSMSSYCDRKGMKGFANWLNVQAQEEMAHAMHMYRFILSRGASPVFGDITAPKVSCEGMLGLFSDVLKHEQWVTERINRLATLAMSENDHASYGLLQWFVNEQVEEEENADGIVQKLTHIGENPALLLMLDTELAARVFVDPFPASAAQ